MCFSRSRPYFLLSVSLHFFQFLKFQQKLEAAEGRQLRPSAHVLLEVWPLPLHPGQLRESAKERKKLAASSSMPALQQGAYIPSGRRRGPQRLSRTENDNIFCQILKFGVGVTSKTFLEECKSMYSVFVLFCVCFPCLWKERHPCSSLTLSLVTVNTREQLLTLR